MSLKTKLVVAAALAGVLVWAHHRSEPSMADTGHVTPVDGATFTSGYGPRWGTTHGGIDLAAPLGTPIRAVTSGTVIEAGPASGFGNWIRIRHDDNDNTVTVYGHMAVYHVRAGQHVTTGERIAEVGNEGQSTGPHLHLEIWPGGDRTARVDPQPWLAQRGVHLT